MSLDCEQYDDVLDAVRKLVSVSRHKQAVVDLREYLTYLGARFDKEVDKANPDILMDADIRALRRLSVSVSRERREWFLSPDGQKQVRRLLSNVPRDLDLWNLSAEEFLRILGPNSPAWKLWELIAEHLRGARRSGRWVTTSKLLHGKRPRLFPICDSQVRRLLKLRGHNYWEAFWCVLQDQKIRARLLAIQAAVPDAQDLSLLRVLDILAWMHARREVA